MVCGIRTSDHCGLNKGCSSKFRVGSWVQQTPEESQRTYRLKCEYNNKDKDHSLKTLYVIFFFLTECQIYNQCWRILIAVSWSLSVLWWWFLAMFCFSTIEVNKSVLHSRFVDKHSQLMLRLTNLWFKEKPRIPSCCKMLPKIINTNKMRSNEGNKNLRNSYRKKCNHKHTMNVIS